MTTVRICKGPTLGIIHFTRLPNYAASLRKLLEPWDVGTLGSTVGWQKQYNRRTSRTCEPGLAAATGRAPRFTFLSGLRPRGGSVSGIQGGERRFSDIDPAVTADPISTLSILGKQHLRWSGVANPVIAKRSRLMVKTQNVKEEACSPFPRLIA